MRDTVFPVPYGGNHPPTTMLGGGVTLTEQAVRQWEGRIRPQWDNIKNIPEDLAIRDRKVLYSVDYEDFDSLAAEAAAEDESVLVLTPGDAKGLTGDLTLPAHVTLSGQAGVLSTNGFNLTVNGPIVAGPWQLFDTSEGGVVTLGDNAPDVVFPQWWGARGEGLTDDTQAVRSMLATVDQSQVLGYFPRGTYNLGSWTPYTPTVRVSLGGDPGATLVGPGRTAEDFILLRDPEVEVRGVTLQGWRNAFGVDATEDMSGLVASGLSISDSFALVGIVTAGDSFTLKRVVVESCRVTDVDRFVSLNGCKLDFLRIAGSEVESVGRRCILVGTNDRRENRRIIITDNSFSDVGEEVVDGDSHAMAVYGERVIITHNHIDNVWNGVGSITGAEAIYAKAQRIVVIGNVIVDGAGGDGVTHDGCGEAAINLKGSHEFEDVSPQGSNVIVAMNMIRFSDTFNKDAIHEDGVAGIQCRCEQVMVTSNNIQGAGTGIRVLGLRNVAVTDNILSDIKRNPGIIYDSPAGQSDARNITIRGNTLDGYGEDAANAFGILVRTGTGGSVSNVQVLDNTIGKPNSGVSTNRAILVSVSSTGGIAGLRIDGNLIDTATTGVQLSGPANITDLVLTNNVFRDCLTPVTSLNLVGSIAQIGGNAGLVTEASNLTVVNEGTTTRVISHGLPYAPALEDITLSPTNSGGNVSHWWVTDVTDTTFTINVDVDPGVGGARFAWRAKVK